MDFVHVVWDLEDEPSGNVQHIKEHGLTPEEVEDVLLNPDNEVDQSRSSDYRITSGYTSTGRYIVVVWQHVQDDPLTMRPVTAYEPDKDR